MTTPSTDDREARRAGYALGAMFFLIGAICASWASRIPALRAHLELGDRALGVLLLCPAAGAMISFRFAGLLIARRGSRWLLRAATTASCLLVMLPGWPTSTALAAVVLVTLGAATGMMDVALNAHGIEIERRLGRPILGSLHGIVCLGRFTGAATAALAAGIGLDPITHLGIAGLGFLVPATIAGARLLHHTTAPIAPVAPIAPSSGEPVAGLAPALPRKHPWVTLAALGAICFCSSASEGSMADWSGVYLRDLLHTSEAIAASGYAVFSLAMLVGRFAGDAVASRLCAAGVVRAGGIAVAVVLGAGLAIDSVPAMLVGFAATGLGVATLVPTAFRAGGRLPGVAHGTAIATLASVSYIAFLAGPPAIGLIASFATLRVGLALIAALGATLPFLARALEP